MSSTNQGSGAKTAALVFFGIILAVAGSYASFNWHPDFITTLNEQGIPLNLGTTLAMIGMFMVLFPVLNTFYFKPLAEAIGDRTNELERTFTEAEDLRTEMQKMRSDYENRLVETEANAREQIQNSIREAQNLRNQLMSEASARADELLTRAQQEIEAEKQKAMTELRLTVVDLTLGAAGRILGENMDNDRNRRLVGEFVNEVEVPA
jgi:F-type H+-transporting ATPase subunit b